eukprot:9363544-Pyramimonas_sp.AAC.1
MSSRPVCKRGTAINQWFVWKGGTAQNSRSVCTGDSAAPSAPTRLEKLEAFAKETVLPHQRRCV